MNSTAELGKIDIYPVGLLHDLASFVHTPDRRHARSMLRYRLRYPFKQATAGNWRAVRQWFNGRARHVAGRPDPLRHRLDPWTRLSRPPAPRPARPRRRGGP